MTTVAPNPAPSVVQPAPDEGHVKPGGWYTLGVILALTLFAFINRQIIILAAAPLAAEMKLSDGQLGMVLGLGFALFTVAASFPIAWLADRFNRRLVIGLCVLTWSIGTAASGMAENFTQLLLATIAVAAGEAGLAPITMGIIPDLFSGRKRILANSLLYVFTALGGSAGLMLSGLALTWLDQLHPSLSGSLQQFSSWRLALFFVALPAPIFLILVTFARLDRPETVPGALASDEVSFLPFLRKHWHPIALVFGALVACMMAYSGLAVWLPAINTRLFGTLAVDNGFGTGLAGGIGMVFGVTAGNLFVRRLMAAGKGGAASIRVAWVFSLLATPLFFFLPFIGAAWHGFALYTGLMIAGSAVGALLPTMLQDMAPGPIRTRFLATFSIVAGLAAGASPSVVGWVSTLLGGEGRDLLYALTLVSALSWLVSILLFRLAEKPFVGLIQEVERLSKTKS